MDTDSIRWFQQVADGVTVTEVSDLEGVSQPAVSRALSRLELQIGTPLLRRSGRMLRMTRAGAAFKRHADALLHELDDGLAAINQILEPESGTVGLAFQLSLAAWLVPDLVSTFQRQHPDVRFELTQVRDDQVESVLDRGDADLVVSTVRSSDPGVSRRALIVEPLRLAVSAGHRLATDTSVRLADLAAESFLMLRPTSLLRRASEELCAEADFTPTIVFEGEDVNTLRGFVAAGWGIAILPDPRTGGPAVGTPGDDPVVLLEITDVRAVREVGLTWSTERRLLPTAELFRAHAISRSRALVRQATSRSSIMR